MDKYFSQTSHMYYMQTCRLPTPSYLRVKDKVFRCAHVLGVWVRLKVDAGGVLSVGAASDCWGNVSAGEIHVRWAVERVVQPHHVRGVRTEVGRVFVKERKRAGQLRLLVDHLEKKNMKWCSRKRFPHVIRCRNTTLASLYLLFRLIQRIQHSFGVMFLPPGECRSDFLIPLTLALVKINLTQNIFLSSWMRHCLAVCQCCMSA